MPIPPKTPRELLDAVLCHAEELQAALRNFQQASETKGPNGYYGRPKTNAGQAAEESRGDSPEADYLEATLLLAALEDWAESIGVEAISNRIPHSDKRTYAVCAYNLKEEHKNFPVELNTETTGPLFLNLDKVKADVEAYGATGEAAPTP